jgi:asparagine synthase (glutamine-hydrolysing)
MCGIAGIINFNKSVEHSELKSICDKISKRGPDAEGFFLENGVGLGHRRLSIIDLETGDQPMLSRDKNIVLVFNGEIYNFHELRKELASEGLEFMTRSDTEVVIQGYFFWGMQGLLERLEGMFAFALYDKKVGQVFIARDKYGEKPLYYYKNSEKIVFASELKAIEDIPGKKVINKKALNLFLSLSYIPAPFTIYEDVKKLVQATYMVIDLDGKISAHQYYDLKSQLIDARQYKTFEEASEHLRSLLFESVEKRMVADVPLGAFLSGGIDSSIITAIMATFSKEPVKTFSIGFTEKEYDESERAELLAKHIGANHTVHYLDYRDVLHLVDDIIDHFDEPFGDSSAIPSFYVAQLARKDVKVVLTGDCADELFGGYEKYLAGYYVSFFKKLPSFIQHLIKKGVDIIPHTSITNSILRRAKKVINNADALKFDLHYQYMCLGFSDEERKLLLNENDYSDVKNSVKKLYDSFTEGNDLEKGFYTDLNIVLEGDMLVKVDRMCMKNSLEARVPFLDSNIVKAAFSMPTDFKIKGRNKKYILKKTFQDLLPPATLGFRKKGFGVPVDYWFNNELKQDLNNLLSEQSLEKQQLFNSEYIRQLLNEHRAGSANHKGKLWNLFVFQKWYYRHFS